MTEQGSVKVLVVPADEMKSSQLIKEVPGTLEALRPLIGGGWLEFVSTSISAGWHAYCDEEGKLKDLPVNERATRLARLLGWAKHDILCGDVIFLGNGPEGTEADVPVLVLGQAASLFQWHYKERRGT